MEGNAKSGIKRARCPENDHPSENSMPDEQSHVERANDRTTDLESLWRKHAQDEEDAKRRLEATQSTDEWAVWRHLE